MKEIHIKFKEMPPSDLLEKYDVAIDVEHKAGFANDERLIKDSEFLQYVDEYSVTEVF